MVRNLTPDDGLSIILHLVYYRTAVTDEESRCYWQYPYAQLGCIGARLLDRIFTLLHAPECPEL